MGAEEDGIASLRTSIKAFEATLRDAARALETEGETAPDGLRTVEACGFGAFSGTRAASHVVGCDSAGHTQRMPEVPAQWAESVRAAYDIVSDLYASRLPDLRAEAPLDLAMLDAFLEAVGSDAAVLDAGCGTGRLSRHLAARGIRVSGIDLSPGMIAEARRSTPGVAFSVASLDRLPFEADAFSGVMLWYSTIHTPRSGQAAIYREAARVLRPGGHLLVGFQYGTGERDLSARYRDLGRDVTLTRYRLLPDEVSEWAAYAGLEEIARLVRRPVAQESDDQAMVLLARR